MRDIHGIIPAMNTIHTIGAHALLDVEIRHLRLVAAVAEEGSITKAGHVLHLTQSALSHQLADLESRLGVQLFARVKGGVVPTSAGLQLLKTAHEVLGKLSQARTDFATLTQQNTGMLRITTQCYTCYHWLPQLLKRMAARYPGVEIRFEVGETGHPLQALAAGRIDVALVYSDVKGGGLAIKPLFDDELVAVVAPNHRLAKRAYLRAADFVDETAIVYSSPRREMLLFQRFFDPAGVEPRKLLQVQLTEAIIEMAKANLGVAVLTRWSVEHELRAGRLVALSLDRAGLHRTWSAAYRKPRIQPLPYFVEFIRLLKESFPMGPALVASTPAGA